MVFSQKAEAQLAYELQAAKEKQKIRLEEMNIDVMERRKQIEVEEKEILRREKELRTLITLPADYEARRVALAAEGERTARIRIAEGEALKIRAIGDAEAATVQAKGNAEADRMSMRAKAYKSYGTTAITQLVLEAMPLVS
jgi:flotillin